MIRVLFFILCIVAAALGLAWFADRPGAITVEWLGYQVETSAFVGALAVIALVVVLILLWSVVRYLVTRPAAIAAYTKERRKQQGLDALSRGLLAIGVGGLKVTDDDHELLDRGSFVYDALYAWCAEQVTSTVTD